MKNISVINCEVLVDLTSQLFVSEIDYSEHEKFCTDFKSTAEEKIQKIFKFFGLKKEKIASVNEAIDYLARKMLSNRSLLQSECFAVNTTDGGVYNKVFAKWEGGILRIWLVKHSGMGAFVHSVIVHSEKECTFKPVFWAPEGVKKTIKNFILDNNDVIWEILPDGSYAKEPNIDGAIRRYLKDQNFGKVILSQMLKDNKIVCLLDSGLIFNGQEICPKNYLTKEEYEALCQMARVSFNNDDSYFISSNMERDITPCLYWEE